MAEDVPFLQEDLQTAGSPFCDRKEWGYRGAPLEVELKVPAVPKADRRIDRWGPLRYAVTFVQKGGRGDNDGLQVPVKRGTENLPIESTVGHGRLHSSRGSSPNLEYQGRPFQVRAAVSSC